MPAIVNHNLRLAAAIAATLLAADAAGAQVASAPASAPVAPAPPPEIDVGSIAPDFTLRVADSAGIRSEPVTLSELRGRVVVLAFYPADRTSGCTAELTKFRDEYARIFGPEIVLLPISVDSLDSHAQWAREMKFPFALGSDPDLTVAKQYGSHTPGKATSGRTAFVIGKDGRILWRNLKFGALNENAYTELAAEIARAR